jgi:hypothetical protein
VGTGEEQAYDFRNLLDEGRDVVSVFQGSGQEHSKSHFESQLLWEFHDGVS